MQPHGSVWLCMGLHGTYGEGWHTAALAAPIAPPLPAIGKMIFPRFHACPYRWRSALSRSCRPSHCTRPTPCQPSAN